MTFLETSTYIDFGTCPHLEPPTRTNVGFSSQLDAALASPRLAEAKRRSIEWSPATRRAPVRRLPNALRS
jgi:hypothetical protein